MGIYDQNQQDYGCPLRFQTGAAGVKNFDAIIKRLPPEQRAAFENERDQRQVELDEYVTAFGYQT